MKLDIINFAGSKSNKILNITINITIILITLLIAINIFKSQLRNLRFLAERNNEEIKKNEVLNSINRLEKKVNSYKNIFAEGRKDVSSALNTISNIANKSAVKIISIKPNRDQDYPQYIKYAFDLVFGANDYHAIGQFIGNLENYSDIYFVDKFNLKLMEQYLDTKPLVKEGLDKLYNLIGDLTLSTIVLKE